MRIDKEIDEHIFDELGAFSLLWPIYIGFKICFWCKKGKHTVTFASP